MRKDCGCYALLKVSELDVPPAEVSGEPNIRSNIWEYAVTRAQSPTVNQWPHLLAVD
jgi:hypothetical protein